MNGGNQNQSERDAPVGIVRQRDGAKAADHQSARPAGVQAVEPFGLVRVEHRGDDGIGVGFDGAVAEAEDDAAPVEQLEAVLLRGRQAHRRSRRECVW